MKSNITRDLSDLVVLEYMPDYIRGSHRAAGNWGSYPHNGAKRCVVDHVTAEELVNDDSDGYNSIVDGADIADYPMLNNGELS